jgi:hypothetical protein
MEEDASDNHLELGIPIDYNPIIVSNQQEYSI